MAKIEKRRKSPVDLIILGESDVFQNTKFDLASPIYNFLDGQSFILQIERKKNHSYLFAKISSKHFKDDCD